MSENLPDEHQLRLAKHEAHLRSGGYPYRFERTATAAELHERFASLEPDADSGERTVVAGRLVLQRSFGRLVFATLQDGTGRIQLMADRSELRAVRRFRRSRPGRLGWSGGQGGDDPQGRADRPRRALRVAGQGAPISTREMAWLGGRRSAEPAAVPRPDSQRGGEGDGAPPGGDVARPAQCVRGSRVSRGGDADVATPGRGRARPSLRHPPQRTRCRHVSPHRPRTAAQEAGRRRIGTGVRVGEGVPQRGDRLHPQPRVHHARGLPGVCRLRRRPRPGRES